MGPDFFQRVVRFFLLFGSSLQVGITVQQCAPIVRLGSGPQPHEGKYCPPFSRIRRRSSVREWDRRAICRSASNSSNWRCAAHCSLNSQREHFRLVDGRSVARGSYPEVRFQASSRFTWIGLKLDSGKITYLFVRKVLVECTELAQWMIRN